MLAGQNTNSRGGKFRLPMTTSFLDWDPARGYPITKTVTRAQLPFVSLTSGFAWMSAFAHFAVLAFFGKYTKDMRQGINRFRWIEYAFSSSLMIGACLRLRSSRVGAEATLVSFSTAHTGR